MFAVFKYTVKVERITLYFSVDFPQGQYGVYMTYSGDHF